MRAPLEEGVSGVCKDLGPKPDILYQLPTCPEKYMAGTYHSDNGNRQSSCLRISDVVWNFCQRARLSDEIVGKGPIVMVHAISKVEATKPNFSLSTTQIFRDYVSRRTLHDKSQRHGRPF